MKKSTLSVLSSLVLLTVPCVSKADFLGDIKSGFFLGTAVAHVSPDGNEYRLWLGTYTYDNDAIRPEIEGGYGEVFGNNQYLDGYLGIDVGISDIDITVKQYAYNIHGDQYLTGNTMRQNMFYYADILPGIVFARQSNLLYLIVGVAYSDFTLKGPYDSPDSGFFSYSAYRTGYHLGIGDALAFTDNLSIYVKYIATYFNAANYFAGNSNATYHPSDGVISLGVRYTFNLGGNNRQYG